ERTLEVQFVRQELPRGSEVARAECLLVTAHDVRRALHAVASVVRRMVTRVADDHDWTSRSPSRPSNSLGGIEVCAAVALYWTFPARHAQTQQRFRAGSSIRYTERRSIRERDLLSVGYDSPVGLQRRGAGVRDISLRRAW